MLVKKEIRQLPVQAIDVGKRIAMPTPARVKRLAAAMKADGIQLENIVVRRCAANTYKIVCGAARLLAARQLGWDTIAAQIVGGLPIDYEIAEMAENHDRDDLPRKQRAKIKRRLKELRKQREAERIAQAIADGVPTSNGGGRGNKGGMREAAREAGIPETTARRHIEKLRQDVQSGAVSGKPAAQAPDEQTKAAASRRARPRRSRCMGPPSSLIPRRWTNGAGLSPAKSRLRSRCCPTLTAPNCSSTSRQ